MNLISKIFNKDNKECPRCLGKGHVDWDDIKRLNKELKWRPGKCAYCTGNGKVNSSVLNRVPSETTYLTIDLNEDERKRLMNNDEQATKRGLLLEKKADGFIEQVTFLYNKKQMEPNEIKEFYLIPEDEMSVDDQEELLDYITRICEHKLNRN